LLKFIHSLKTVFHRPQAIERWVRIDRIEQKRKEGWRVIESKGDLILMRKG